MLQLCDNFKEGISMIKNQSPALIFFSVEEYNYVIVIFSDHPPPLKSSIFSDPPFKDEQIKTSIC